MLKNAWFPANLANLRLAALASDVAYQEYRRQMMVIISTAEASYWNLYLTQEQVRFFRDSVLLAESLVTDNQARVQAGKAAELEVLEAQAGLALRRSKLAEAEQKYYETTAQLFTLLSHIPADPAPILQALDRPGSSAEIPGFVESGRTALDLNPDYLGQIKKMKQEDIRVAYAKNQRLPQLDLKASYGLNGLGPDAGSSWDEVQTRGFPSFSAGLELHIPLGGGIKARRELDAARLRKQQALVGLKDTESQILNAVESALRKVGSAREATQNYQNVVSFNQTLLATELARLEAGKVGSRRVLEVDASLFEAKNAVIDAQVQYERARLELELVQGTILRERSLDLPQKELQRRTASLLQVAGISEDQYRGLAQDLQLLYEKRESNAGPGSRQLPGTNGVPTLNEEDARKARRLLLDPPANAPTPK
jgi:outer membrane protein TolC